jgi:hypothetical protein
VTLTSRTEPIIRRMKLWLTITNLYHFTAWFVGWESYSNVTKPLRDPWF